MRALADLSLSRQFLVTSLPVLVVGMLVIGVLVSQEVKDGVVNRMGGMTGLYVESFVAPHVQTLRHAEDLTPDDRQALGRLLHNTPLGDRIVSFKVWLPDGRVLYSSNTALIGRKFPIEEGLEAALNGSVHSEVSPLEHDENSAEAGNWDELIETYVPIHGDGTGRVIAVAEFYQTTDELNHEALFAQARSWGVVALTVLTMYLLLFGLVHRGSRIIGRQRQELKDKVAQLSELIAQNESLHERVRRAAAGSTAVNEQFLRQISSDLHDGPGQDMGLALMQVEALADRCRGCLATHGAQAPAPVDSIRSSLTSALTDLRSISGGLRLPDIDRLPVADVARRAIRDYERKSGIRVDQRIDEIEDDDSLPVRIALYRLLQEALSNGYRHAGGVGQRVEVRAEVRAEDSQLWIEVADAGAGFDPAALATRAAMAAVTARGGGQGLVGMRERAELLGGSFEIVSSPGRGTTIRVSLPLGMPEIQDA